MSATVRDNADWRRAYGRRIAPFLLLSLLVHGVVLPALDRVDRDPPAAAEDEPMEVTVARRPPPEQPSRQVVDAPPVANRQRPAEGFLGTRDQTVEEETIAPDVGEAANRQQAQPAEPEAEPEPEPAKSPDAEGIEVSKLLPDPFAMQGKPSPPAPSSRQPNAVERPTGPVTLLNTKSHPYSQYLIDRGHRAVRLITMNAELTTWYVGDVRRLRLPAVVHAVVDAEGRILRDGIEESSGSGKVDHLLLTALRGALRGSVPPAEAMEGGQLDVVMALDADVLRIGIR